MRKPQQNSAARALGGLLAGITVIWAWMMVLIVLTRLVWGVGC